MLKRFELALTLVCAGLTTGSAWAQSPIDVQRHLAKGEYYESIKAFYNLPERRISTDTRIAAGKSAWALSLAKEAISQFDAVLRDPKTQREDRAEVTLLRGIIEFQEGRYPEASLYAEKAVDLMGKPSPQRAKAQALWGQALMRSKAYGAAEEKLSLALTEANPEDIAEIHYWIGSVRFRLGRFTEARKNFESIPMSHDRTPQAIKYLARIAMATQQYKSSQFWLTKGRTEFPDQFLESWIDYDLIQSANHEGDSSAAKAALERVMKEYPPSDPWVPLVEAAGEIGAWKSRIGDLPLASDANEIGGANVSD